MHWRCVKQADNAAAGAVAMVGCSSLDKILNHVDKNERSGLVNKSARKSGCFGRNVSALATAAAIASWAPYYTKLY